MPKNWFFAKNTKIYKYLAKLNKKEVRGHKLSQAEMKEESSLKIFQILSGY